MDVSHFGLFDFSSRQARRIVQVPDGPAVIANDNAARMFIAPRRAATRRQRLPGRAPLRVVDRRDPDTRPA